MRNILIAVGALLVMLCTSCGGGPSEQDINNSLDDILRSAAGDWTGVSNVANPIRLDFTLQQASNGQLSGRGTMKEGNAAAAVPITVTGTYVRPVLTLSFSGMVYESRQVTATAQGNYNTVGGVSTTLKMTGASYARDVDILLQEK